MHTTLEYLEKIQTDIIFELICKTQWVRYGETEDEPVERRL